MECRRTLSTPEWQKVQHNTADGRFTESSLGREEEDYPRLLEELPKAIKMGELNTFRSMAWKRSFYQVFSDGGWGLYAMLGLVTLVLAVLIVKLFPKI